MPKKPKRQNLKPAGKCIFCGNGGISKEHLFADWLRALFPRTAHDSHTYGRMISDGPKPQFIHEKKHGHSGSRKVKTVCRKCNNEWISDIDNNAKNVGVPLIKGDAVVVTPDMQKKLAIWFSKMAMVGDSVHKKTYVLQYDRAWLKNMLYPPILWEIWIGSYNGSDWRDLAFHQEGGILNLASVTGPNYVFSNVSNVQATTIGIGKMVALVVMSTSPAIPLSIGNAANVLTRIWPIGDTFAWPHDHILSDREVGGIANIMRSAKAHPIRVSSAP